jgi:hypothetical protein
MIRSSLLTYWTGKDIETKIDRLNDTVCDKYLERLWSILESGIWMNINNEKVIGWSDNGPNSTITMDIPMVCFTELRLSQSKKHYSRYGLLGIVVDRQFVLDRQGGPVFYIRSHPNECIVGNLVQMLNWIHDQSERGTTGAKELFENVKVPLSYLKAMSSPGSDDFETLSENEWRIAHTIKGEKIGLIKVSGQDKPKYKIPLSPKDLMMIVLPDSQLRDQIIQDEKIANWFNYKFPPLLTVSEIGEF